MAEIAFIVAFDIQDAGPGWNIKAQTGLGTSTEASVGFNENEAGGLYSAKSGLIDQVATCRLVELKAANATEAIAVVREKYLGANAGAVRAVKEPNVNFKIAI